jgi:hypothetical protein
MGDRSCFRALVKSRAWFYTSCINCFAKVANSSARSSTNLSKLSLQNSCGQKAFVKISFKSSSLGMIVIYSDGFFRPIFLFSEVFKKQKLARQLIFSSEVLNLSSKLWDKYDETLLCCTFAKLYLNQLMNRIKKSLDYCLLTSI